MERFFFFLKRGVVATIVLLFAFVALYVPQQFAQPQTAHAGGGRATEVTQLANNALLGSNLAQTTSSAISNASTAFSTGSLWLKENVLDGIGWAIAKRIVSSMVQSLIDWINSGFEGSPAFITDFTGFLTSVADEVIGEYISELGEIGSFICSPFRLDAQLAVAVQYAETRGNGAGGGQNNSTCTLSGVFDNFQNFLSGTFSQGGWDDWLKITSNPTDYTPYGAVLNAEITAKARLINAEGQELAKLDWGDGFLSGETCREVSTPGGPEEECVISKPGKVIQEALSFNLDSGRQSLISADEINEIIAALFGQLANTAITGINGLLGLSSGNAYSYSDYEGSYLDQMVSDSSNIGNIDNSVARQRMADALTIQQQYRALALTYIPQFESFIASPQRADRIPDVERALATAEEIASTTAGTGGTIAQLQDLLTRFDNPATTEAQRQEILTEYTRLNLYSENQLDASEQNWPILLR